MESYYLSCKLNNGCLLLSWYIDDSDEWGGNDFIKHVSFNETDTFKLFETLGIDTGSDVAVIKSVIAERFSDNLYVSGHKLKEFCALHDIHYSWHEYVDQPGIFDQSGIC